MTPKAIQAIAVVLHCLPEVGAKSLLLKIPQNLEMARRGIEQDMTQKPP